MEIIGLKVPTSHPQISCNKKFILGGLVKFHRTLSKYLITSHYFTHSIFCDVIRFFFVFRGPVMRFHSR